MDLGEVYARWADEVYAMTVPEVSRDYVMRTVVYGALQRVYEDHGLLVTPTLAALPVLNAEQPGETFGSSEIEGVAVDPSIGWCMTYLTNYTGHPSASIPAGMADGLPVGMQLVGRRYADADVLAAGAAFERLRPWQHTYEQCDRRSIA